MRALVLVDRFVQSAIFLFVKTYFFKFKLNSIFDLPFHING